jgi:hypothetical protein
MEYRKHIQVLTNKTTTFFSLYTSIAIADWHRIPHYDSIHIFISNETLRIRRILTNSKEKWKCKTTKNQTQKN